MRIDEVYKSVQGEGPRVGYPTIFVRTGGCNLRCPGWPCDTQHAIDPAFRDEWKQFDSLGLAEVVWPLLTCRPDKKTNICLTGGEPFLQKSDELREFVSMMSAQKDVGTIECFSNGTLPYPDWALEQIAFVMDWKLPGSGEYNDKYNEARLLNFSEMGEQHSVKFTIADKYDYEVAKELYENYVSKSLVQVFYGVVWGKLENDELIKWVLDDGLPWLFNMQIHNHVWDRNLRGI